MVENLFLMRVANSIVVNLFCIRCIPDLLRQSLLVPYHVSQMLYDWKLLIYAKYGNFRVELGLFFTHVLTLQSGSHIGSHGASYCTVR